MASFNFKVLKLGISLRGTIARRVFLRALLFATAMVICSFILLFKNIGPQTTNMIFSMNDSDDDCVVVVPDSSTDDSFTLPLKFLKPLSVAYAYSRLSSSFYSSSSSKCNENVNLTIDMFQELIDKKFIVNSDAKGLCVGEGSGYAVAALRELGFSDVLRVKQHSFFLLNMRKQFTHELDFKENSFDFVYSRALDRVSVPAMFVLEIERVLKPGGIGAFMLAAPSANNPGGLIKTVTPISTFLRSSEVVHVRSFELFSVVVFKKKLDNVNPFEQFQLPGECSSVKNNKPFMEQLEPLAEEKTVGSAGNFTYLPKLMDISSRKRFFYIDIGSGQHVHSNSTSWFFTSYPVKSRLFNVYVVDHDTSVLSYYVNKPGITFVYHPGLAGNKTDTTTSANHSDTDDDEDDDDMFPPFNDEWFDFLVWFKETVADEDFVVLKMNADGAELKLLYELYESGAICLVDELFLRCPGSADGQGTARRDCLNHVNGLRSSGVFVHQWLEE